MPSIASLVALTVSLLGAEPLWPDLSVLPAVTGGAEKDAAVVVAVEDYAYLPDVQGAGDLGVAWYMYLGKARLVPFVTLLKDSDATPAKIRHALEAAAKRVKQGGRVWFVFIGHGAPSEDGKDGALVGVAAQADQDDFYPQTMTRGEVLEILGRCTKGALPPVMVVDACFSGTDLEGRALLRGAQFVVSQEIAEARDATILTAGRAKDIAGQLPGAGGPAFAYLVLGALRGWGDANGDSIVTAREAVQYAQDVLLTLDSGRRQQPQCTGKDQRLTVQMPGNVLEKGPDLIDIKVKLTKSSRRMGGSLNVDSRLPSEGTGKHPSDSGVAPTPVVQWFGVGAAMLSGLGYTRFGIELDVGVLKWDLLQVRALSGHWDGTNHDAFFGISVGGVGMRKMLAGGGWGEFGALISPLSLAMEYRKPLPEGVWAIYRMCNLEVYLQIYMGPFYSRLAAQMPMLWAEHDPGGSGEDVWYRKMMYPYLFLSFGL